MLAVSLLLGAPMGVSCRVVPLGVVLSTGSVCRYGVTVLRRAEGSMHKAGQGGYRRCRRSLVHRLACCAVLWWTARDLCAGTV